MARMRRGSVPVEYILVVAGVAAIGMLGAVFPRGLADMMIGSATQMDVGRNSADADLSPFAQGPGHASSTPDDDGVASPFAAPPTLPTPPAGDDWGDDPWGSPPADDGEPKPNDGCNQGKGNGAEGCDPGNSNQGDPTRSNDELVGTTRGRGR